MSLQIDAFQALTDGIWAALAAAGGGGLFIGICKYLVTRAISQHDEQQKELIKTVGDLQVKIAVLESNRLDAKRLEKQIAIHLGKLRGRADAHAKATSKEVEDLRIDLSVAHDRIRLLAAGDTDFSKVRAPDKMRRR